MKQLDISKIERGETLRSVGLLALARAYGVNPDWLDTGCGEMLAQRCARRGSLHARTKRASHWSRRWMYFKNHPRPCPRPTAWKQHHCPKH